MRANLIVAAILFAAPWTLQAAGQPPAQLPTECEEEAEGLVACHWTIDLDPVNAPTFVADLSWVTTAILDGRVESSPPSPFSWTIWNRDVEAPVQSDGAEQSTVGVYLLEFEPGNEYEFVLSGPIPERSDDTLFPVAPVLVPSTFDIAFVFEFPSGQVVADEPAGSPEDPQLKDALGDQDTGLLGRPQQHLDLTGAWFDDPILDDGLIEVGLVIPHLDELEFTVDDQRIEYHLEWTVLGQVYHLRWLAFSPDHPLRDMFPNVRLGWDAFLFEDAGGLGDQIMKAYPRVDSENGTISCLIPVRAIGDPADGIAFTDLVARSNTAEFGGISGQGVFPNTQPPGPQYVDEATEMAFPFALGGPDVWAALRGEEPEEPPATKSWYQAPFTSENLPDTLQVVGAVLAGGTFLFGLWIVRRRRERLARLLDDVDAVLAVHDDDADAALRALDRLESRFDEMFKAGKITDSQHSVLETRIERAGYRLLRKGAARAPAARGS